MDTSTVALGSTVALLLRHRALTADLGRWEASTDQELLAAYDAGESQVAFAEIMRRYGPMVLRTCQRVLGRGPDAEDAFQVTFLSVVRQTARIREKAAGRESLGGWLHRVACQTATKIRVNTVRRKALERKPRGGLMSTPDPLAVATWNEVWPILDAELDALPDQERRLLIACYLRGKTHAEAAAELGLPLGSLARRLDRACALLAERLVRRGITLSAALLATLLGGLANGAGVPAVLLVRTVAMATGYGCGAAGAVPTHITTLVQKVLKDMTTTSWIGNKCSVILACCLIFTGAGMVACRTLMVEADNPAEASQPDRPPAQESANAGGRVDCYGDPLPEGALARLGTVRFRSGKGNYELRSWGECSDERGPVPPEGCALSPDGKTLAQARMSTSGAGDKNSVIFFWDAATGKYLRKAEGPPYLRSLAYSPDGKLLAAGGGRPLGGGQDNKGQVWFLDAATGKLSGDNIWGLKNGFDWMRFAPDGKTIAGADHSGVVICDVNKREELRLLKVGSADEKQRTGEGVFSGDGRRLAYIVEAKRPSIVGVMRTDLFVGGQVHILDPSGEKEEITIEKPMVALAFTPDGKGLVAGAQDKTIRLWDAVTGDQVRRLGKLDVVPTLVAFLPDGKTVLAAGAGQFQFIDAASGKEARPALACKGLFHPYALFPDGKVVVERLGDVIRLWDVATGREVGPAGNPYGLLRTVTFSPDGKMLATAGKEAEVRLWDATTGKLIRSLPGKKQDRPFQRLPPWIRNTLLLSWTARNALLALEPQPRLQDSIMGVRRYHRWKTISPEGPIAAPEEDADALTFSPDGAVLARMVLAHKKGIKIEILDLIAKKKLCDLDQPYDRGGYHPWLIFSSDHRVFASFVDVNRAKVQSIVGIFATATGKKLSSLINTRFAAPICFSPDGRLLMTYSPGEVGLQLWEVETGHERMHFSVLGGFGMVEANFAFSSDGRFLAAGCLGPNGERLVRVWDLNTGKEHQCFKGLGGWLPVTGLAFSPDGRRLASVGSDYTGLIWEVKDPPAPARPAQLPGPQKLNTLVSDLARNDGAVAYRAMCALIAIPDQAVPLLAGHLRPDPKLDPKRVAGLVKDLDSDDYKTRVNALKELRGLGGLVAPALRKVIAEGASVEVRKRLEELLEEIDRSPRTSGELRALRGIEVLERINNPSARELLQKLAKSPAESVIGQEAQAALKRLEAHPARHLR